jgi:signal transduction histidine kinase
MRKPGILARIRRGEKIDHYETVRRHKDGHLLEISLNVSPVYDSHGVIVGASKIVRDITEHKRIDKAVRERETARAILDAQESERARIARDLHDHLGQQMTALDSDWRLCSPDARTTVTRVEIEELRRTALKIDREIGFLAWEMRPTEIDVLGLEGALMSFIQEWSSTVRASKLNFIRTSSLRWQQNNALAAEC